MTIPTPTPKPQGASQRSGTEENVLNLLRDSLNTYVVSPLNAFGLGGFVFDVEGDTQSNLTAEITDHYLEDNTAVQDQIAIRPLEITLNNYVGELVFSPSNDTDSFTQQLTQKLTTVTNFLPALSDAATQAKETLSGGLGSFSDFSLSDIPSLTEQASDLWSLTRNLNPAADRQQQAYLYFKSLLDQKILVGLQTPFEYVTNMAVQSIQATQPESSRFISNFTITLKQIRVVSTEEVPFNPNSFQGRGGVQRQPEADNGKTQGVEANASILYQSLEGAFGL